VGTTLTVSLAGVFSDADSDTLTITASSDDETVATVAVASDASSLTVTGVAAGTARLPGIYTLGVQRLRRVEPRWDDPPILLSAVHRLRGVMEKGLPDASEGAFLGGRWRPERAWEADAAVADGAVRRVLVLGDIHNRHGVLDAALTEAQRQDCDALVSVGDFWLQDCSWDARRRTRSTGDPSTSWTPLMRLAMAAPLPILVIDGNHEAWPCLTDYALRADVARARAAGRPLHLGGTLWWADRGSTWTWSGRRCGALGGAVSPDKFITKLAPHRWPDHEAPSRDDLGRLLANAPDGLDVLFCHDAPAAVAGLKGLPPALIPDWILAECREVRGLLQDAVERTGPQVVFHGHWHQTNHAHIGDGPTEVFGLNRDGKPGSVAVLDLRHFGAAATTLS